MAGRCDAKELPEHLLNKQQSSSSVDVQICWDLDSNFGGEELCNSNGKFLPLQPQHSFGLDMDLIGPEMALAHSLSPRLEKLGIKRTYFIKFALGSTNLHTNWNPSNTCTVTTTGGKKSDIGYYPQFLKFCKESIESLSQQQRQQQQQQQQPNKNNKDNESPPQAATRAAAAETNDVNISRPLWGVFWLQGESDSSKAKTANAYLNNFKNFIHTLRRDLDSDCPVVVSPVIWHGKKVHVVNEALMKQAPVEIPNCLCIDPLDKEIYGVQGDDAGVCAGHLTTSGLCEIGHRMGMTMPLPPLPFLSAEEGSAKDLC